MKYLGKKWSATNIFSGPDDETIIWASCHESVKHLSDAAAESAASRPLRSRAYRSIANITETTWSGLGDEVVVQTCDVLRIYESRALHIEIRQSPTSMSESSATLTIRAKDIDEIASIVESADIWLTHDEWERVEAIRQGEPVDAEDRVMGKGSLAEFETKDLVDEIGRRIPPSGRVVIRGGDSCDCDSWARYDQQDETSPLASIRTKDLIKEISSRMEPGEEMTLQASE